MQKVDQGGQSQTETYKEYGILLARNIFTVPSISSYLVFTVYLIF